MLSYYVIRTAPRGEQKFLISAQDLLREAGAQVLYPRRKLTITKGGKKIPSEAPLFPGYLFLETPHLESEFYWALRNLAGFGGFLRSQGTPVQVLGRDLELLKHFLQFGEVIGTSQVFFDENQRIRVVKGPMVGLEGQVIRVDRRKRRARIRLDFQNNPFTIDLGFEDLGPQEAADHGR